MSEGLIYQSAFFSVRFLFTESGAFLKMQMKIGVVNTRDLLHTYNFIQQNLPSVLNTQCFNEQNLPFFAEVKKTELGHLFEHILLEQLCLEKMIAGSKQAVFSGNTAWNWEEESYGTFNIKIMLSKKDRVFLPNAIDKSLKMLEHLFYSDMALLKNFGFLPEPMEEGLTLSIGSV